MIPIPCLPQREANSCDTAVPADVWEAVSPWLSYYQLSNREGRRGEAGQGNKYNQPSRTIYYVSKFCVILMENSK